MISVVVIDYDMGNIRSIMNKADKVGYKVSVSNDESIIDNADKIILPGVGHFQNGIKKLKERNLIDVLNKKALIDKVPILGICLGMQLFTGFSEEGNAPGLGWIEAKTIKFKLDDIRYKVPHMGWNSLAMKKVSPIFDDIPSNSYFYFVHSFHVICNHSEDIIATSNYGYAFVAVVQKENIFGTQFHPEKSHELGEKIISNFLKL